MAASQIAAARSCKAIHKAVFFRTANRRPARLVHNHFQPLQSLHRSVCDHVSIGCKRSRASEAKLQGLRGLRTLKTSFLLEGHTCLSAFQRRCQTPGLGAKNKGSSVRASSSFNAPQSRQNSPSDSSSDFLQLARKVANKVALALAVAVAVAGVGLLSLPWFLSTPQGLKTSTSLINLSIPGTVSVASLDLGWRKEIKIGHISLKDAKGVEVLRVKGIESEASLLNLVRKKSGLGNTRVEGLRVDLAKDEVSGAPKAFAALTKQPKQLVPKRAAPTQASSPRSNDEIPIKVEINVEMPGGSLKIPHATFNLPWDTAALTGEDVQVDIAMADFAARRDPKTAALAAGEVLDRGRKGGVPLVAAARSEKFRGAAAGTLDVLGGKLHLARPLDANIEINPSTGRLFLARLNPLLAGVVGTKDSGHLVQVFATPRDMVLPTEQYDFHVEPMTLILGPGELVSNALQFVGQRGPGKTVTIQTSAIRAAWNAAGRVEASRTDVRIGDKVHLITWGKLDLEQDKIDMVLAVPSDTLKVALRVPSLASAYNLQVPLTGSVERPSVDWKAAGKQLAKLVLRQRAPNGWTGVLLTDRNDHRALPEPLDPLPWAAR